MMNGELSTYQIEELLAPYDREARRRLMTLFKTSPFTVLEILNVHYYCHKSFELTELVLETALKLGISPYRITDLVDRK